MSSYTMRSETAPFHHHIADQPSSVLLSRVHYQLSRTCRRLMPWQSYFMDDVPCILSPFDVSIHNCRVRCCQLGDEKFGGEWARLGTIWYARTSAIVN